MIYQILKFITPHALAQSSLMGEFRSLVCPGANDKRSIATCLANLNLNDTIVLVNVVVRVAFGLAGVIALIYLIYSGYLFMTSLGNPDAVAKAKSKLLLTVLGLVIIILAYAFVAFILNIIGAPGATMNNPVPS
jgi:hypothetical protein